MKKTPKYTICDDFGVNMPKIICEPQTLEEIERISLGITRVEYFKKKFDEKIIENKAINLTSEAKKIKSNNTVLIKV